MLTCTIRPKHFYHKVIILVVFPSDIVFPSEKYPPKREDRDGISRFAQAPSAFSILRSSHGVRKAALPERSCRSRPEAAYTADVREDRHSDFPPQSRRPRRELPEPCGRPRRQRSAPAFRRP